jgi:hypothetical protein
MNDLIVIKYHGDDFTLGNIENFTQNFFRDSGVVPINVFDENNRNQIFEYLDYYNFPEHNLIIHIQSHGFDTGICKMIAGKNDYGDSRSLIRWEDLIDAFNRIAQRCNHLTVNLGAVCNSINILQTQRNLNFDLLVTKKTISNQVTPRKINKNIFNIPEYTLDNETYLFKKKQQ